MKDIVWQPADEMVKRSNIWKFMETHSIKTYQELLTRCNEDIGWFWDAVSKDLGISWFKEYDCVFDASSGSEWTRWFLGGQLNISYNCLDRHATDPSKKNRNACVWEDEDSRTRILSYGELHEQVNRLANSLIRLGARIGDPIGLYLPMTPEAVSALLACFKIGAICIPIFPGFAAPAIASRLNDVQAKYVLTADATARRGKKIPLKSEIDKALHSCPSVRKVLVDRRLDVAIDWVGDRDVDWREVCTKESEDCTSVAMPSEDIALVLYTSGTTGKPKGTVHTHAGALLQCAKEVRYYFDVKPDDVFFWLTDIGWMMGPWMIMGSLTAGACIVLAEGAIDYPNPDRLWSMIERHRVTILGISPTAVRALMKYENNWIKRHYLSSLRILGSAGEPWDPESWQWYFEKIGGRRCPIINISGGTEIIGCLLSPLPITPLKPCTLGGPGLGMDVDVFDDDGIPVRGKMGYLVCKKPAPSMTKGFWKDPERYLDTYWSRWPGIWYHGDWASIDEDGYWFVHGRVDDVIKVAGRRLGPAEIESFLLEHPAVSEAAAVGVPDKLRGEILRCFVVLKPSFQPNPELGEELMGHISESLGRAFRPQEIGFVKALPKTRSGKIARGAIRALLAGKNQDLSTLENPEALLEFQQSADVA